MPAPSPSWNTVRVHGTWVNQDGSLKAGTYKVTVPVRVTNATDDVIIPAGVFATGTLNTTNGLPSLDLQVPATDDPDNLPSFQIQIAVTFPDALGESYQIDVPVALSGDAQGIDLRAVVLASTFTPTPALIRGVPGGIAGLDANGDVVDASGTKVTAASSSMYVNAKDAPFNAVGNGTANDTAALNAAMTAALAANKTLYLPAGTYKITSALDWRSSYLRILGDGPSKTKILQATDNVPILQTGGDFVNLEGFALQYANIQSSANTAANCWEINDGYMGQYNNIQMYRGYQGLFQPQTLWGARTQNCVFSSEFRNLEALLFAYAGFNMAGYIGNNTGNVFSNLYLHNKEGSTYYPANFGARFKQTDEMDLRQLNVEHGAYIQPLAIDTVRVFNAEALHFEDCRPGLVPAAGASANGFVTISGDCKVILNALRLNLNTLDNTASALSEYAIISVNGVGPDVEVTSLYEQNTTKTNSPTFRKVRADSSATTAAVRLRKYTCNGATNANFDALAASRSRPLVRVDGDTQAHLVTATAALGTAATNGFLYVPSITGTPTGTPTTETGNTPLAYDTTNGKLWIYQASAWTALANAADVASAAAPGPWQTMTLTGATSTAGYYTPAYRLAGDVVQLRGRITFSAAYTGGVVIATLSAGWRPSQSVQPTARATSGQTAIQVTSTGDLSCVTSQSSGAFLSLDGIEFTL